MIWIVYVLAGVGACMLLLMAGIFIIGWLRPPEVPYLDADGFPMPPRQPPAP